ncbi:concanavalin A-like lectin/glucanase domain-containing protein [Abortiporus biennis]|nr:concanavalin A-like lectin/glucanase domain-containing protein [Abortiporus biennis]
MKTTLSLATLVSLLPAALAANFTLIDTWQGSNFFDGWDFVNNFDNTTNGDVNYISPLVNASANQLAFVNSAGQAIIKVDNVTNVPYPDKRDSIRISTSTYYEAGTVWIFDATHLPYGCSVWPSFWTKGQDWPRQGEIDIVEGINLQEANQMALHTFAGCTAATGTTQTGITGDTNCNSTTGSGCTVGESNTNSFGANFASSGGGVWATQFDASGIFIWFWSRSNVPASITTATDSIDLSSWGTPSAAYPASSCTIGDFFGPQQLVIDITLCGDWAGVPSIYQPTCGGDGSANGCYVNSVINAGSPHYDNAYFEINYVKAFGVNSSVAIRPAGTSPATSGSAGASTPTSTAKGSGTTTSAGSGTTTGGAVALTLENAGIFSVLGAGVLALASGLFL